MASALCKKIRKLSERTTKGMLKVTRGMPRMMGRWVYYSRKKFGYNASNSNRFPNINTSGLIQKGVKLWQNAS